MTVDDYVQRDDCCIGEEEYILYMWKWSDDLRLVSEKYILYMWKWSDDLLLHVENAPIIRADRILSNLCIIIYEINARGEGCISVRESLAYESTA
ncbi:hypothetical protein ACLOJK_012708 [Asimina triloba]